MYIKILLKLLESTLLMLFVCKKKKSGHSFADQA